MHEPYGWTGKIGLIDLGSGRVSLLPTRDWADAFVGGRGIAARLYWDLVSARTDALGPESALMLMAGPLAGTPAPACSRLVMLGTSPLLYPEQCTMASIGGTAAARMKAAGFDGLVISGRAPRPVVLHACAGTITLRPAADLWGRDIDETLRLLGERAAKGAGLLCIGPAGEQRVRLALVGSTGGSCAGHGFGAVWGAKNLKAIVLEGRLRPRVARPDKLKEVNQQIRAMIKGRQLMDPFVPGIELVRRAPCQGCPAGCPRGLYRHGSSTREEFRKNCGSAYFYLEEDTLAHGGQPSGDSFAATGMCDRLGLDTQELGKMFLWLKACRQRCPGVLASIGLSLQTLGSLEFIRDFLGRIAARQGFGDVLAEGVLRAAAVLGPEARACTEGIVENAGFAADLYNPRYFITNAVFHAVDPNPMTQLHEVCYPLFKWVLWYATDGTMSEISTARLREIARRFWGSVEAADFSRYEGKGAVAARVQDRTYAKETLVGCDFFYPIITPEGTPDHVGDPTVESRLLSAVTGCSFSEQDYYRLGERAFNLQRAIQAREGRAGRAGDVLPECNFSEPLLEDRIYFGMFNPEFMLPGPGGELITRKGAVLDRQRFSALLREYYRARGWDEASGLQTRAVLGNLGLECCMAELQRLGALAPETHSPHTAS